MNNRFNIVRGQLDRAPTPTPGDARVAGFISMFGLGLGLGSGWIEPTLHQMGDERNGHT